MLFRHLFLSLSLFVLVSGIALANGGGINGRTGSNLGCLGGGCHAGSSNPATTVTFTSKSGSFTVAPNGSLEITVVIAHATQPAAGFNAAVKTTKTGSANVGTLSTSADDNQVFFNEVTHTSPKAMSGGKAEFTFTWTAPAAEGTYFLRAAGNAVNLNGSADGSDSWNFATPVEIVVKQSSGVDVSSDMNITLDVFPNPTSEYATVKYNFTSPNGATLEITDLMGRSFVKQPLENSSDNITVGLQSFPAGIYQVQVRAGSVQQLQRLVVVK